MTRRLAAASLLCTPIAALAQTERVTSGLSAALTWMAGLTALLGTGALMYAAWAKMWGDQQAQAKIGGALVGGIIGLGAGGIMALLKQWFSTGAGA